MLRWVVTVSTALGLATAAGAMTADEILAAMDHNRDYRTVSYQGTMEIHVAGQVRTKNMKAIGEGTSKALVEFTNPQDEGVKFLKVDKELWIYFPSEQEVVKISGHMLKEGMMGSDVSYEDALESDAVRKKYRATLDSEETYEDHACYVLTLEAVVKDAPYYRRRMWVDKKLFIGWKEEMYAKSGKLLKEARTLEVKRVGAREYPVRVEMINKLRKDSKTVFTMEDLVFDVKLPPNAFSMQHLQR
jgi:outer membrane lipoprotein-sorting protein